MMQSWQRRFSYLVISGAIASWDCAYAQITPDTTLGNENSTVTSTGTVDAIDGGATRGANLFHSFEEFNINEGRTAVFTNPVGIENILTRVTGANPSTILGTLGVAGNANLFLMNPNGIIFGQNARLDIGGSFVGTTANAIAFGDRGFLSATNLESPSFLLTVNPSALIFNQIKAGAISNRSIAEPRGLQVPQSKSLLLVGGNVSLDGGQIFAPGGRIELAGVAGVGTVGVNVDSSNLRLKFPEKLVRADVSLNNSADVNVRAGGGGSIALNARNINISEQSELRAGMNLGLGSVSSVAGNIEINATGLISIDDSEIVNTVLLKAIGNGGDINIQTMSLAVTNGAQLQALTEGQGDAGNININARDTISFDGVSIDRFSSGVFSTVEEIGVGNGGNINITTGSLSVINGAQLASSSFGSGNAGNIQINARDTVSFNGAGSAAFSTVEETGVGNGGNVDITTGSLSVINGAQLASGTRGRGDAGDVNINARDTVSFDGVGITGFSSGAFSTVELETAVGNGGNVDITTGSLSVINGAQLASGTRGRGDAGDVNINARDTVSFDGLGINGFSSGAFSTVELETAVGNGGNVDITTGSLSVINGAVLASATRGQGNAGDVNINARDTVFFDGIDSNGGFSGAFSTVQQTAVGNGGNINITTGSLSVINGAELQALTRGQGDAGDVNVNARDTASFNGESGIFSTVEQTAVGDGGNINITTRSLSVTNGAGLTTSSEGSGAAGNIIVAVRSIYLDNQALLSSDTVSGQGNIFLSSRDLILRRGSNITTNAVGTAIGGNITINTDVLAALENSDISANAEEAFGGRVIIKTQGIFGTQFRETFTSESDITATSNLGSEFNGTVEINTPDIDPSSGLVALPTVQSDTEIVQACTPSSSQADSEFVVTGRGGLPPTPTEALNTDAIAIDWVTLNSESKNTYNTASSTSLPTLESKPIVEAQGWIINKNGQVVLTASVPTAPPHNSWQRLANCSS